MTAIPPPEFLSYEDLREEVRAFVTDFDIDQTIPVNIERIVDARLGLDIVPVPGLMRDRRIDGYLSADRSTIYVDEDVSSGLTLNRYRFTLAHELGHWYLHEDLYQAAHDATVASFADFINAIPPKDWSFFEWQAYAFAGLLLVPRDPLAASLVDALAFARAHGFPDVDVTVEAHRDSVAEWIGRLFAVSGSVIVKRGGYDGLWPK